MKELSDLKLITPDINEQIFRMFCYWNILSIFMVNRSCWFLRIYLSLFVIVFKKISLVFFNIIHRYLKRMNFCSIFCRRAHFLQVGECAFWSVTHNDMKSIYWSFLTVKVFLITSNSLLSMTFSIINEWTLLCELIYTSFPCGKRNGSCTERLKSSWYHCWALHSIPFRSGASSCFTYRYTPEIIHNEEMYIEDPCSNFVSSHSSPERMNLNSSCYAEVSDDVGRDQTDLLLRNLVVEKLSKIFWDEEATLKGLASS